MMTRLLPREEWPRLVGTELERVWPVVNPDDTSIIVIEQDGVIVGCWAAIRYWHLEGLWTAPAYRRKVTVARRLWMGMRRLVTAVGAPVVLTAAVTEDVRALLTHVGATKLPGDHYVLSLGKD